MKLPVFRVILLVISIMYSYITYAQVPTITGLSVSSGAVGSQITISGTNFNATYNMNVVSFGAGRANINSGNTTSLVVNVPYCTTYEPISVVNLSNHLTGYYKFPFRRTLTSRNSISPGDFDSKVDIATGAKPNKVLISDLDGDGKSDIIVANATGSTISVYHNEASYGVISSSMFTNKTDLPTNGNPTTVDIMDINGDGSPDIVVTNSADNSVCIYRNTSTSGYPTFAAKLDLITGNSPFSLAIGDLDLDGKPDLAVANLKDSTISIFKNTSASTNAISFSPRQDFYSGWAPNSVKMGDLDGDGKMDIVVANIKEKKLSIFRNTSTSGTISLNAKFNFDTANQPSSVNIADIDLDGKLDILVANYGMADHSVSVFRNTATSGVINAATFAAKVDFSVGSEPTCVMPGDIDGDGKIDLAITNFNSNSISVLRNTSTPGTISYTASVDYPTGFAPESVYIGDVDGDGAVDMLATNNFQNNISVLRYYIPYSGHPVFPESTASASIGSFVNTDLTEAEWKNEVPSVSASVTPATTYYPVSESGGFINGALNLTTPNAGRFAYFYAMGSRTPVLTRVDGNLTFTAQGSGTIDVRIIATYDGSIQASHKFTLGATDQNFSWDFTGLYPELEYYIGVIFSFNDPTSGLLVQAKAKFKKNFALSLRQAGLAGNFTRYRADGTSLIGNSEATDASNWSGYSDSFHGIRKKYIQHSAYARMKFQTDATHMVIEYVREFYDKRVVNLFPVIQNLLKKDFNTTTGAVITGNHAIDTSIRVKPTKSYTISGLTTHDPVYVWFSSTPSGLVPMGAPVHLNTGTNYQTVTGKPPVYKVTAPAGATNLGLLIMRITNISNYNDPGNDNYYTFSSCMVQEGSPGDSSPDGVIPSTDFKSYAGSTPSYISGPTVYINGRLYKYYQIDGIDYPKQVQYLADDLPPGMKTVEIVMPGQGALTDYSPLVRRSGTFLRAVYFPASNTTVLPYTTKADGSIVYIHDSILSGYNISSNPQHNVWMMKIMRDPTYGFTGDVFSEGYAGRILHTDTQNGGYNAFATKLISFGVKNYWFQLGVNDFGFNTPLVDFYTEYKALVEKMHDLRSDVKIYIQSTGPEFYEDRNSETTINNGSTPNGPRANDFRDVQRAIATSHSYCEFVDFENLIDRSSTISLTNYLPDGIHPNDAGNLAYANGIRDRSSLLGQTVPTVALGFNRTSEPLLTFDKGVKGVSVIRVKGGQPPYTYTLSSGTLPTNLNFNFDGTISGPPASAGNFPITVQVQDAAAQVITASYTIKVNDPLVLPSPSQIAGAQVGVAYSKTFSGSGGAGPYTVTYAPINMWSGFSFNTTTGTLSGLPTAATPVGAPYTFTITSTDYYGRAGSKTYTLPVTTAAPATLRDTMYLDYSIDLPSGNVYLTARVKNYYSSKITAVSGIGIFQGSSSYYFNTHDIDLNWGIEAQNLTSPALYVGHITPNTAVTRINKYPGSLFPGTIDGVTIVPAADQTLYPPY